MTSPSVKNNVTTFRYLQRFGVMDNNIMLRGCNNWPCVQKNMFPGEGSNSNKVFLFKMSEVGLGNGVDLVKRMQPGDDLQDAWIMFDYVKRIKKWTTMACHVITKHGVPESKFKGFMADSIKLTGMQFG
jgi:hypothetical protein